MLDRWQRDWCTPVAFVLLLASGCSTDKTPTTKTSSDAGTKVPFGVYSVHAHNETSYALMTDGTVRAWGSNGAGALGTGVIDEDVATPVVVSGVTGATALHVGGSKRGSTACVLVPSDSRGGSDVKCWGHAALIVGVSDSGPEVHGVPSLRGVHALALGGGHGCAVMADHSVSCWGYGAFGWLGLGRDARNKRMSVPTRLADLSDVVDIDAGSNHSCVVHRDETVSCWGNNFSGQADPTDPGNNKDRVRPKKVAGITGVVDLALGANLSCALNGAGEVRCWGAGFKGGPKLLAGVTGVKALWSGSGAHSCVVRGDGTLSCWGRNNFGEAGAGDALGRGAAEPIAVEGLSGIQSVATAADSHYSCAASSSGAWCWGRNRYGGLGDGSVADSREPTKVIGLSAPEPPAATRGYDRLPKRAGTFALPAELPEGCGPAAPLAVKLVAEPRVARFEIRHAAVERRARRTADGSRGDKLSVSLRSYPYDPSLSTWKHDQRPRGAEMWLKLELERDTLSEQEGRRRKQHSAQPVAVGSYLIGAKRGAAPNELRATLVLRRRSLQFLKPKEYAGLHVTHVDDDWLCGDLELAGPNGSLRGKLVAPITKK